MTPTVLQSVEIPAGRAELVEWHWPSMIDFVRRESELMLEMSLPPMAADASACLPEIDESKRFFMGTLFVRWPEVKVSGRSQGGHIRVVRCVLARDTAHALTGLQPQPALEFLQRLLDIRNEPLRYLMRLLHRELVNPVDRSDAAIAAITDLIALELRRLIGDGPNEAGPGRLAAWQFRKIRERLEQGGPPPSAIELAALCGISTRHLHRQFAALTGKTVTDYIETARMEHAKCLLAQRDNPIKAVALGCGFAHANSFSRAFRRVFGISPQSYRQRIGPA